MGNNKGSTDSVAEMLQRISKEKSPKHQAFLKQIRTQDDEREKRVAQAAVQLAQEQLGQYATPHTREAAHKAAMETIRIMQSGEMNHNPASPQEGAN